MKLLLVVLSLSFSSLSFAASNDACIIAFHGSDLAGRKRAQRDLAAKSTFRMTPEIAHQAMRDKAVVSIGSLHNPGNAQIGVIWKVRSRSFDLLNRWGFIVRIPFSKRNQYFNIESPRSRELRLLWIKRQVSEETQVLIESAQQAHRDHQIVEVRFVAKQDHAQYRQTFRGRVLFVDVREVWDKGGGGLLKHRDQITLWMEHPQLKTERISAVGKVLEARPVMSMSLPVSFDLTGPEAIELNQFTSLR